MSEKPYTSHEPRSLERVEASPESQPPSEKVNVRAFFASILEWKQSLLSDIVYYASQLKHLSDPEDEDQYGEALMMLQLSVECEALADHLLNKERRKARSWIHRHRSITSSEGPIADIRESTRRSEALSTSQFGFFLEDFFHQELRAKFSQPKHLPYLEERLAPLRRALQKVLGSLS